MKPALFFALVAMLISGCGSKEESEWLKKRKQQNEFRARMKPHEVLFVRDDPEDSARVQQVHLLARLPELTDPEEFTSLAVKAFCNYPECKIWMWSDAKAYRMWAKGVDSLNSDPASREAYWKKNQGFMADHLLATYRKGEHSISQHFIPSSPTIYDFWQERVGKSTTTP